MFPYEVAVVSVIVALPRTSSLLGRAGRGTIVSALVHATQRGAQVDDESPIAQLGDAVGEDVLFLRADEPVQSPHSTAPAGEPRR